jgi:DNA repair exonuclease SbcCD nuclease subunit
VRGEVDLVVHTGDLFDRSRPPSDAVATARRLLGQAAARVPVVVIPGNHDRHGLGATIGGVAGVRVCDRPERLVVAGLVLAAVPYERDAADWAAAARLAVGPGADLLLAHQAFHGVRVPGFTFRAGAGGQRDTIGAEHLPVGVGEVLCGHLHPRQIVHVGSARVVCPGSTERTAFSEAPQAKGYALWERPGPSAALGGGWNVRLVDLPTRPLLVLSSAAELDRVVPGAIVRCPTALAAEVHARGGWIAPARAQLSLFERSAARRR